MTKEIKKDEDRKKENESKDVEMEEATSSTSEPKSQQEIDVLTVEGIVCFKYQLGYPT